MSLYDTAAVIFVTGIAVGAVPLASIQWLVLRRQRQTKTSDDARDLAMRVVLSLDDFVGACYAAATDFPEIDLDDPSEFFFHTDDPILSLPKDVEWSLLGRELSDEARWLPNRLRNLTDALESIQINPPDYGDIAERRQDGFARLGIRTLDLIERLCVEYQLPRPERPDYYDPRKGFMAKIRELQHFWRRRAEAVEQVPGEKSNVTPIFGRGSPENRSS